MVSGLANGDSTYDCPQSSPIRSVSPQLPVVPLATPAGPSPSTFVSKGSFGLSLLHQLISQTNSTSLHSCVRFQRRSSRCIFHQPVSRSVEETLPPSLPAFEASRPGRSDGAESAWREGPGCRARTLIFALPLLLQLSHPLRPNSLSHRTSQQLHLDHLPLSS